MSKIKFIEAEFHNADKDRRAIRQRLERFLKTRRALERGIMPPAPEDRDDRLRWENELMQVGLGREGQDRVDRRVSRLAERRAAAAGLSHLKLDDRRALEVLRNGVGLIPIGKEHKADEIAAGIHAGMPWMAPATDLLWKSMRRSVCYGDAGFCLPPVLLDGPPGNRKKHVGPSVEHHAWRAPLWSGGYCGAGVVWHRRLSERLVQRSAGTPFDDNPEAPDCEPGGCCG